MRQLTHYELTILIKHELNNMLSESNGEGKLSLLYIEARAKTILNYIQEYNSIGEEKC